MTQITVRLVNCTLEELDEILKRHNLGPFTIKELSPTQVQITFKEQESKEHIMETLDQYTSLAQIDTQETISLEKDRSFEEEQRRAAQQKLQEESEKQQKFEEMERKVQELTVQMSQLNEQFNRETTEKGLFQKKYEHAEVVNAQLENKHARLTEENAAHVAKIADLEADVARLQEQTKEMQSETDRLKSQVSQQTLERSQEEQKLNEKLA